MSIEPPVKSRPDASPSGVRLGRRMATLLLATLLLATSLLVSGCALSRGPADTASPTLPAGAYSTLDDAGVERILASRTARLDMRSGNLEKSDVGLPQDDLGPEINTRDPHDKVQLTIVGPSGEISGETDRIRFNTVDTRTDFSVVTYFLTTESAEEYFELIRDGVDRYGIDGESAERWITSAEADPEHSSEFSLVSGTSTGLEVNYDLRYDATKNTQVIIVNVSPIV
ncbi:hypothetical protein LWF01_01480 [Saxibacter everestensis]|uniref:Lipoprotein n=1 Tax=Saxibacter everestensis TaxID=2909229 RepID=A0ABY8QVN4_9MICO|nr:hypothetical protein LWF01_01480 [Brevibacteriaceae bacterium ZFBP1038]